MIPFAPYMAWCCPECGEWVMRQIFQAKKNPSELQKADYWNRMILTCLRCGKSTSFKYHDRVNVRHVLFERAKDASNHCRSENFKKSGIVLVS